MICRNSTYRLRYWNASFGIEYASFDSRNSTYRLRYWNMLKASDKKVRISNKSQQYLPFTVLKRFLWHWICQFRQSQQYLPFTVLKHAQSIRQEGSYF